jgi:PleD family two-component response regulator
MLYNVLVVDDDHGMAEALAAMIRVLGHTVGIAYGPRMAMQQLNEVIPDVIFLDINMPGVDGFEVLRYLRRDPYTHKVPVIIVSANDAPEDKQKAMEAGANFYAIKPPTIDGIEMALKIVMEQRAAADAAEADVTEKTGSAPPKKPNG